MTSKRLMDNGESIINLKNRNLSTGNLSSVLDKSVKSIKTNSTFETPQKDGNNIKEIIGSYSLLKKNSSFKNRLSTQSNNFNSSSNYSRLTNNSRSFINYIPSEPNKNIEKLIGFADNILKERRNNHLNMNKLVKSVYMRKMNEIRLDNYKIKLLTYKRNELNNKLSDIYNAIRSTEKIFDKDYQRFLDFVDKNNRAINKQEFILNNYKKIYEEKEAEYNKLCIRNKRLKNDIEYFVKRILVLKQYGSFIHNVFKIDFMYENIKRPEAKNYFNIAEQLIKIYEKHKEKGFDDKLLDEYWLMAQFSEFEQNIMKNIYEREEFKNDCIQNEIEETREINKLKEKVKQLEKVLEMSKKENDTFIKSLAKNDTPENIESALDYIAELTKLIGLKDASSIVLLKEKTPTNYTILCSDLINNIKEKEFIINNYIKEIESILNGENEEDKLLIESFIMERKKEIKKDKLSSLIKERKDEIRKKNKKAVERAHRIIIKGRKVIDYYPFIKIKKKRKKVITENNDNEYLCYSSESDN